jgi:pimeloyl-ACP methyl ester carboxylesterase
MFARIDRAPPEWRADQLRLALRPGVLETAIGVVRAHIRPLGQREVLLDELACLALPTLVVWGAEDRIIPPDQGRQAVARLRRMEWGSDTRTTRQTW